jgi:hypothetical protein
MSVTMFLMLLLWLSSMVEGDSITRTGGPMTEPDKWDPCSKPCPCAAPCKWVVDGTPPADRTVAPIQADQPIAQPDASFR